jgi:hypothetical protein
VDTLLDATWTAEQVMKTFPRTVPVFLALKTDCVGCYLDKFCTLGEVAVAYALPLDGLLQSLREAIQSSPERGENV